MRSKSVEKRQLGFNFMNLQTFRHSMYRYANGVEARLHDIIVAKRIEHVNFTDSYGQCDYDHDCGEHLAEVVNFHSENRKNVEVRWLVDNEEKKTTRIRSSCLRLADFRDFDILKICEEKKEIEDKQRSLLELTNLFMNFTKR